MLPPAPPERNPDSCIPKAEQHDPEGQMLVYLVNTTHWLDITPSNTLLLSLTPFHFVLFKLKDFVAKQHPMELHVLQCTASRTCMNNQWTKPGCYAKSPTAQDTFQPIPSAVFGWLVQCRCRHKVRWKLLIAPSLHMHRHWDAKFTISVYASTSQLSLVHRPSFNETLIWERDSS